MNEDIKESIENDLANASNRLEEKIASLAVSSVLGL